MVDGWSGQSEFVPLNWHKPYNYDWVNTASCESPIKFVNKTM